MAGKCIFPLIWKKISGAESAGPVTLAFAPLTILASSDKVGSFRLYFLMSASNVYPFCPVFMLMGKFDSGIIEGNCTLGFCDFQDLVVGRKDELHVFIDEFSDEPGARYTIDLGSFLRKPISTNMNPGRLVRFILFLIKILSEFQKLPYFRRVG
jgi:hypothetical protein